MIEMECHPSTKASKALYIDVGADIWLHLHSTPSASLYNNPVILLAGIWL
ncbi:hypothetical protein L902_03460 [Agrobacterium radiobacter DSM 30147]|nr:hypothetical protein L902_03460 [Agrobacterium radiobacter DSM 30147]